jgi:DNA-binding FadR family transcriptional regulator
MDLYDVSKGPVRQAIETLKTEGLVAGRPGKGVYVIRAPVADDGAELPAWALKFADDIAGLKADVAELQSRRGMTRPARRQERGNEQSG